MANVGRRLQQITIAVRGNGVIRALFGFKMKSWAKLNRSLGTFPISN